MPTPEIFDRFTERYSKPLSEAALHVQEEVLGAPIDVTGYTTISQATELSDVLALEEHELLLDLGSGRGWPGLHLARASGCRVVLADVPEPALRAALDHAARQGIRDKVYVVMAHGVHLPFRSRSFDAVTHTDAL